MDRQNNELRARGYAGDCYVTEVLPRAGERVRSAAVKLGRFTVATTSNFFLAANPRRERDDDSG